MPTIIATWPFGKLAVDTGLARLLKGEAALDAALAGAQAVEDDTASRTSVGFGSLPDRIGRLTLDACVMDGRTLSCGAVAGLEHVRHPAAVARRVMEKTPHIFLVGEGAKWFALQEGFPLEYPYTVAAMREWEEKHPNRRPAPPPPKKDNPAPPPQVDENNHDTVTVLAHDQAGHLGGVCTTSGLAYKMHGRVGDSPIIGAGLFVDPEVGAATATGLGEAVIKICGSHLIVEMMRMGASPQRACEEAVKRISIRQKNFKDIQVGFLAINKAGEVGAFAIQPGFQYALAMDGKNELKDAFSLLPPDKK